MRFARAYQNDAAEEVVKIFEELSPARLGSLDEESRAHVLRKRISLVVAPTASGKTMILEGISDRLKERGHSVLVLTHLTEVAAQNRAAGLTSSTIQNLFSAFRASGQLQRRGDRQAFVAKKLSLPLGYLTGDILVAIDESHWGAETFSRIYNRVLTLLKNARLIVGFTGTPRFQGAFHTIDLTQSSKSFVAEPLGSVVYTHSLLTVYSQVAYFPTPCLFFTRNVASAALITMAINLIKGKKDCLLLVGSGQVSLEGYLRRTFPSKRREHTAFSEQASSGYFEQRQGIRHGAGNLTGLSVDEGERRLSLVTMLFVLDALSQKGERGRVQFHELLLSDSGLPNAASSLRLMSQHRPDIFEAFKHAVLHGDQSSLDILANAIRGLRFAKTSHPRDFKSGRYGYATSVYKVGTGFDYPSIRTVCFAESTSESEVLYKQRAGRGARKLAGKPFYDVVDVVYHDPMSASSRMGQSVSWLSTLLVDRKKRLEIQSRNLIFRVPCRNENEFCEWEGADFRIPSFVSR